MVATPILRSTPRSTVRAALVSSAPLRPSWPMLRAQGRVLHHWGLQKRTLGSLQPLTADNVDKRLTLTKTALPPAAEPTAFTNLPQLMEVLRQEIPAREPGGQPHTEAEVEHISRLLSRVQIDPREWGQYTTFVKNRYTRTLVGYEPKKFTLLMLCWEKGQQSPIHDHAGASCWVKMLSGQLQEVIWVEDASGKVSKTGDVNLGDARAIGNDVMYMSDVKGLHTITNPSQTEVAVSLHCYAPPFEECKIFRPNGTSLTASMVASNAPSYRSAHYAGDPVGAAEAIGDEFAAARAGPDTRSIGLKNFMDRLASMPPPTEDATSASNDVFDLVGRVEFTEEEWATYCSGAHFSEFHYTRNLLYVDDNWSVLLNCWNTDQGTPSHRHGKGRHSWCKVLHGDLVYEEFASAGLMPWEQDSVLDKSIPIKTGDHVFSEECTTNLHRTRNPSETEVAVSLHLYSPPYTALTYQDEVNGPVKSRPVVNYAAMLPPKTTAPGCAIAFRAGSNCDMFTNLQVLVKALTELPLDRLRETTALLRRVKLNALEYRNYAVRSGEPGKACGVLLAQTQKFALVLGCWGNSDQASQGVHDLKKMKSMDGKGIYEWVKVLEGELIEQSFDEHDGELQREAVLATESVTLNGPDCNPRMLEPIMGQRAGPCFSLHLYAPPPANLSGMVLVEAPRLLIA